MYPKEKLIDMIRKAGGDWGDSSCIDWKKNEQEIKEAAKD